MQLVYLDVLFFFNFGVDYLILSLTLKVAHLCAKEWQLLLASFLGALGACLVFFTPAGLFLPLTAVTLLASGFAVFGKQKPVKYPKLFCLLFCIAFAFGGGIYALCSVFGIAKNGVGYLEIPVGLFIFMFLVLYLPIRWAYAVFNRKKVTERKILEGVVRVRGQDFPIKLLSDTGNTLKEPVTGKYVLLCDSKEQDNDWIEEIGMREAVERLTPREKQILEKRFFQGKTQMQVADEIGISQAQVSRLEKNALDQIKNQV